MPSVLRPLLLAIGVTGLLVTLGVVVLGGGDDAPAPRSASTSDPTASPTTEPTVASTPLADLATDRLVVRRQPFCPLVPEPDVATALASEVASSTVYGNGEDVAVAGGPDVAHEEGCRWESTTGDVAAAWVFVPPVTVRAARGLVRSIAGTRGCRRTEAPAYGTPSMALVCRTGRTSTASLRGLFGDAWLTCTLTGPRALARLPDWCAAVATAASAP